MLLYAGCLKFIIHISFLELFEKENYNAVSYTHLRSVDFADEAVVDFYFLLTASVLALDSFVDGYFFN